MRSAADRLGAVVETSPPASEGHNASGGTADPPGLRLDAVAGWLDPHVGGLSGPLRAEVIAGGRSNLTYVVRDDRQSWILRRPPLAHVLPTAHDMAREHRMQSALGATAIPVPDMVALCEDQDVLGVTFYVMEHVIGHVVRDELPAAYADTPVTRQLMSRALVTTLADLHEVSPGEIGLGAMGRPEGYLERQLRRWWQQWEASRTRPLPHMEDLRDRLTASIPVQGPHGIVHGDYRLDNLIMAPADPSRILAVLDWEMSTIGDPLADLGLLLVYWADSSDARDAGGGLPWSGLTAEPGFLDRAGLVTAYAERSTRDLSSLDWYVALGAYKLAIVAEGIHARYLLGMTVGEGFETMGARVRQLVDAALERASASAIPGLNGRRSGRSHG